jgi:hypothetical protein
VFDGGQPPFGNDRARVQAQKVREPVPNRHSFCVGLIEP